MELDGKLEERKRNNAPFLTAFEHVRNLLDLTKGKMCELLNIKASRLSEWDKGEKPVPEPVKYALVDLSVQKDIGQLSIDYLDGYTDIMLLANIPDDELAEIKLRRSNPDYDVMQQRLKEKERKLDNAISQSIPYIDPASQQNASISAYIQLTNRLEDDLKKKEIEIQERMADKDAFIDSLKAHIAALERTVADKDTIIKDRESRIVALERQLASASMSDIERYPFTIGAADDGDRPRAKI